MLQFLLTQIGKLKSAISGINSDISNLIKSDTATGTTTAAGILYCDIPRNRVVISTDCSSGVALLNYPEGHTNMLMFTTDGTKLYPVVNTNVSVKYYYTEIETSVSSAEG